MTKTEFIYALERGLGRAYITATENSEILQNEAVKALTERTSFDVQCEGTRADYAIGIISHLGATARFRDIIINKLFSTPNSDMSWDTAYYAELLSKINDSVSADALRKKYKSLYCDLSNTKSLPFLRFPERDNFEQVCVSLCKSSKVFREIASDIADLIDNNPNFDCGDFDWFILESRQFIKRAEQYKKKGQKLCRFLELVSEREKLRLIELDRRKNDPTLAEAARKRLEDYKNRALFQDIPLPQSEEELIKTLETLDIDKDNESGWHSFHFDIFDALERGDYPEYLKSALPMIYKTTRCSNCRFRSLRLMAKFKMLSREIIEECLYDSNDDIRTFAKRRINKAKQPRNRAMRHSDKSP